MTVLFGSNAPKILRVVEKEFQEELKVMKGELERPEVKMLKQIGLPILCIF